MTFLLQFLLEIHILNKFTHSRNRNCHPTIQENATMLLMKANVALGFDVLNLQIQN